MVPIILLVPTMSQVVLQYQLKRCLSYGAVLPVKLDISCGFRKNQNEGDKGCFYLPKAPIHFGVTAEEMMECLGLGPGNRGAQFLIAVLYVAQRE